MFAAPGVYRGDPDPAVISVASQGPGVYFLDSSVSQNVLCVPIDQDPNAHPAWSPGAGAP
jgi:hypothetical protein